MYEYKALITDVYDGDTITVDLDLGLGVWLRGQRIRLTGINAPEMRGRSSQAGVRSRDALRMLALGKEAVIRTEKDKTEKYGRWLGTVLIDNKNLNEFMVETGLAERYE